MALDLTQLNSVTKDLWWNLHDPEDIAFTENALLWILFRQSLNPDLTDANYIVTPEETLDGGKMIRVFLEYDSSNRGTYGQGTVINQAKKDIFNAARFRWGGLYASNALGLDDQVQNAGDNALVRLAMGYIENIKKSARLEAAEAIISRTDGDDLALLSLADLFSTDTATSYGSIAEDDMASWKANVITDETEIDFEALQLIWRTPAIGQSRKKKPNLGVTTEKLKDGYERTLDTQKVYENQTLAEAGFDNVTHKKAPIVADDNVAEKSFYALNTYYLKIKAHKDYNFTAPEWVAKKEAGEPDTMVANTRAMLQMVCSHRKAHVYHNNMIEPT